MTGDDRSRGARSPGREPGRVLLPAVVADRLDLPPLTAEAIEALMAGDRAGVEALTGAAFPTPLGPPPLMDDALPFFRDRLRAVPADASWWARVLIERGANLAVGSAGFAGPPDAEGTVTIGYAVYPEFHGRGFATEATRALVAWALARPPVRRVRATIPPGNAPSRRVAEAAGLRRVGTDWDDDAGEVLVYETESARDRS